MPIDPRIILGLTGVDTAQALDQGRAGLQNVLALQQSQQNQQIGQQQLQIGEQALQAGQQRSQNAQDQQQQLAEAKEFKSNIQPFIGKDPFKALENVQNSTVLDDDDKRQIITAINAEASGNPAPLQALTQLTDQALGVQTGGRPSGGRVFEGEVGGQRGFFQTDASGQTVMVRDAQGVPVVPSESQASISFKSQKLEAKEKKELRLRKKREQAVIVSADINDALSISEGFSTTGFLGSLTSNVPGTPGFDLKERLKGVKANVGFNKLQDMRESSPTGGALGQVSDKENALLQSVFGSLEQSQSKDQLQGNLKRLDVLFNAIVHGTQPIPFTEKDFNTIPSGGTYISPDTGTIHRKP